MQPLVSICLPCLNARDLLAERMSCVLTQTMNDWELVVCDSFSDDGSWEFLQGFAGDARIQLHRVERAGLYAGWNECIKRARGEFVCFAPADDTSEPMQLESMTRLLRANPSISVCVCGYRRIDGHGREIAPSKREENLWSVYGEWMNKPSIRKGETEVLVHACFGTAWVTMSSVMFRRSLIEKTGLFSTAHGSTADVGWAMRASLNSDVAYVPEKLATWRWHAGQATAGLTEVELTRQIVLQLVDLLDNCRDKLPAHWMEIEGWRERILRAARCRHLDSYRLYRGRALQEPAGFARNLMEAMSHEPGFATKQLLNLFRARPDLDIDPAAEALDLIRRFGVPWPPVAVTC